MASLQSWEERNLAEYAKALALELATEGKDATARQLAGLCLKNLLVSPNDQLQIKKHDRWKEIPGPIRAEVKGALLRTFVSEDRNARHTAGRAAAEVAAIELPYREWGEFVPTMLQNVRAETSEGTKIASLECLGFACERIGQMEHLPNIDEQTTNEMLTAVIDGIQQGRPENVRLVACVALKNSLLYAQSNMERKQERDHIMANVLTACSSSNENVRKEAFACISSIAYLYYEKLQEYMQHFFELTTNAIKNDEEPIAKEAIEFWSTICESEIDYIDEEVDLAQQGVPVQTVCRRYVQQALEHLVPLLLEAMTKHPEDALESDRMDQFTIEVAASTCLTFMAQTVEDAITASVLPFVQSHIQDENWHYREAAIMAFGCILEGASTASIGMAVQQSIPVLLSALGDANIQVKHTTAFTISKVCEAHSSAIPQEVLPVLVNTLIQRMQNEKPNVATQLCTALNRLGAAFDNDDTGTRTGTNSLSPYMKLVLESLMKTADRPDAKEGNLRTAAFETINVYVANSAPDCKPLLLQLLPAIVERFRVTFSLPVLNVTDRDDKEGLQGLLCGLIQVLVQNLERPEVAPLADAIMTNLIQALESKSNTCHNEAFLAIDAIADIMAEDFEVRSYYSKGFAPPCCSTPALEIYANVAPVSCCWVAPIRCISSMQNNC